MKKYHQIIQLIILFLFLFWSLTPSFAQNSIKFGIFVPPSVSETPPPKTKNAECTEQWAEQTINNYKSKGVLQTLENASYGLLACDVYRYLKNCTNQNDENCTRPCIYIVNGPSAQQIQNYPGVKDNLNYFYGLSDELFRKYWLYTKAIGRFDLRNGFGLTQGGKDESAATLRAMTCGERAQEINHHIGTPLYFYTKNQTNLTVSLPNRKPFKLLSFPDGTFLLNNQFYSSLAYDLPNTEYTPPKKGRVIDGSHVENELTTIAAELSLNTRESKDFVSYWKSYLPVSSYYFVSLFSQKEAQLLANWQVKPPPDSQIRYIFYFKPLIDKPTDSSSYSFQPIPRIGFTVLDWGGVIDW